MEVEFGQGGPSHHVPGWQGWHREVSVVATTGSLRPVSRTSGLTHTPRNMQVTFQAPSIGGLIVKMTAQRPMHRQDNQR